MSEGIMFDHDRPSQGRTSGKKRRSSFITNRMNRWFRALTSSRTACIGLILIMFIGLIALFAPLLAPTLPSQSDPTLNRMDLTPPKPPGSNGTIGGFDLTYPMGTGAMGEDIYYGVIWGARTSLVISVSVVGAAVLIGIVVGSVAGYYGGVIDEILMRISDVFLAIPSLILALGVVAVLGRSLDNLIIALIIAWWPGYARLIRGQVLSIKEKGYVESARAIGAKESRILFRHVLPNSISPLISIVALDLGVVLLTAAGLSFIGFGPSGLCEWGRMISSGIPLLWGQVNYPFPSGPTYNPWWTWFFPGLFIFIFVLGFGLLGDGLRDIMDPRTGRRDSGR